MVTESRLSLKKVGRFGEVDCTYRLRKMVVSARWTVPIA